MKLCLTKYNFKVKEVRVTKEATIVNLRKGIFANSAKVSVCGADLHKVRKH